MGKAVAIVSSLMRSLAVLVMLHPSTSCAPPIWRDRSPVEASSAPIRHNLAPGKPFWGTCRTCSVNAGFCVICTQTQQHTGTENLVLANNCVIVRLLGGLLTPNGFLLHTQDVARNSKIFVYSVIRVRAIRCSHADTFSLII